MSDDFNFSTGMPSEEMAEYVQMFVDETSEQLDDLVSVLLVLETNPDSSVHLNESFRLVHSIKGASAMMGLDSITLLTHHLENHFEQLRSGIERLDQIKMNLILRCVDFLRGAVHMLREGRPLFSASELIEQLTSGAMETRADSVPTERVSDKLASPQATTVNAFATKTSEMSPSTTATSLRSETRIAKRVIVYLDRTIEMPELKAELIIARLSDLAVILRTSPDINELVSLAELRTLQIWLESARSDQELKAAADIVGVELIEVDLIVDESSSNSETAVGDEKHLAESTQPNEDPSSQALSTPSVPATEAKNVISAETQGHPSRDEAPDESNASQTKVVETLRVDIQRLDRLMNLAGELVVNRARFVQLASQMKDTFKKSGLISHLRDLVDLLRDQPSTKRSDHVGDQDGFDDRYTEIRSTVAALEEQLHSLERGRRSFLQLNEAIDQFSRVSDGLQRGVLDTRMVPVGPLFNRFKRTVRDVSLELGKKVNLIILGENTELDKRMIDELGDPLVHLVRNAIDHGLESETIRRSRSKSETGTLTLEAAHSGNNVLITISDDGGGINTEKVKRRAIERGLITSVEGDLMTEREIAQFVWAPGFSTAEVVSDISGRGVGMDIVKTRISELNGTIEVDSSLGAGTKFVIRLPLTLAIIRSLLFHLEQGTFAAPIENVREIVSVRANDVISVHGRDSIEVRGEFIPLVRIEDVFDWHKTPYSYGNPNRGEAANIADTTSVLILTSSSKSMGLIVSELKGCQDIVVKSLDENFAQIRGLAGASILGDGSVCLLLDVVSCLELARQRLRNRDHQGSITNS